MTAKGIKAAKLKRLPFAVPPVEEQKRIVEKVAELTGLLNELEAALTAARTTQLAALRVMVLQCLTTAEPIAAG